MATDNPQFFSQLSLLRNTLGKQLVIFKAKAYLKEHHAEMLKKRLKQLKMQHFEQRKNKSRDVSDSDSASDKVPKTFHIASCSPFSDY